MIKSKIMSWETKSDTLFRKRNLLSETGIELHNEKVNLEENVVK